MTSNKIQTILTKLHAIKDTVATTIANVELEELKAQAKTIYLQHNGKFQFSSHANSDTESEDISQVNKVYQALNLAIDEKLARNEATAFIVQRMLLINTHYALSAITGRDISQYLAQNKAWVESCVAEFGKTYDERLLADIKIAFLMTHAYITLNVLHTCYVQQFDGFAKALASDYVNFSTIKTKVEQVSSMVLAYEKHRATFERAINNELAVANEFSGYTGNCVKEYQDAQESLGESVGFSKDAVASLKPCIESFQAAVLQAVEKVLTTLSTAVGTTLFSKLFLSGSRMTKVDNVKAAQLEFKKALFSRKPESLTIAFNGLVKAVCVRRSHLVGFSFFGKQASASLGTNTSSAQKAILMIASDQGLMEALGIEATKGQSNKAAVEAKFAQQLINERVVVENTAGL